jgi:putative tryptophan/tyrosine transport system substrate-binding protein
MKRRAFISGLGITAACQLLGGAYPARAQTPNRIYRLGHLAIAADSEAFTRQISLPELARLGFVEGRNLVFDGRVGQPDALAGLMGELLAARPDAIVAVGPAMAAAGAATRSVPIVTFGYDPIELGLAASYAQPGGNVTGVVILASELEAKRLSILLEAVPGRRRIAVLLPSAGWGGSEVALRKAASGLGVELLVFAVAKPDDYLAAFAAMRAQGAQALLIGATPQFQRDGKQLAALALETLLPTVCEWADMAQAGCLIGYGPSRIALRKRMADQIARIFRGVAPGDIAIERPTVFEFVVNQKVAKSLELNIPSAVLVQADEVID